LTLVALALVLTACKGAEPQITHWHSTGSYTMGVCADPMIGWDAGSK